jgi:hypothetical protein
MTVTDRTTIKKMSIDQMQALHNLRIARKRQRKHRVGISITVNPYVKKQRKFEKLADSFRNEERHEVWLKNWKRKNKKN